MSTSILLYIYFSINLFSSGYYLGNALSYNRSLFEKIIYILFSIVLIFLAIPIGFFILTYIILKLIYMFLNETFQISFFFKYFLTEEWNNLPKYKLKQINNISKKKPNKGIKNRLYKYGTKLINKKNNYTPD
jgi:Ni,Fe-hydrogenase I cytochrome b subunit